MSNIRSINKNNNIIFCKFGSELTTLMDLVCAILLALSPLLQHYKGLLQNAGYTAFLICFPWLFIRLIINIRNGLKLTPQFYAVIPLIIYFFYSAFIHNVGFKKSMYSLFMVGMLVFISLKCVNVNYVIKSALFICALASILLIIQYICFYILGFHLVSVPISLFLEESSSWILGAQTGLYNIRGGYNGFYRPSAFFLEPSHLAIFFTPCLCILLINLPKTKTNVKLAILLTLGILLSTSGLGIIIAVAIWGLFILFYYNRKSFDSKALITTSKLVLFFAFVAIFLVLFISVDTLRNALIRIFVEKDTSSAIGGRVNQAFDLIKEMRGSSWIIGVTDDASDIIFNLPGFFATIYKKGLIGLLLSYIFYSKGLFKSKGPYFWLSFIIIILSFFTAHTHGTFYMMFFIMFLVEGFSKEYRKL